MENIPEYFDERAKNLSNQREKTKKYLVTIENMHRVLVVNGRILDFVLFSRLHHIWAEPKVENYCVRNGEKHIAMVRSEFHSKSLIN